MKNEKDVTLFQFFRDLVTLRSDVINANDNLLLQLLILCNEKDAKSISTQLLEVRWKLNVLYAVLIGGRKFFEDYEKKVVFEESLIAHSYCDEPQTVAEVEEFFRNCLTDLTDALTRGKTYIDETVDLIDKLKFDGDYEDAIDNVEVLHYKRFGSIGVTYQVNDVLKNINKLLEYIVFARLI